MAHAAQARRGRDGGGRGLLLVESLAHRWGVYDRAGGIGKTVWAELKAPKVVVTPVEREVAAVTVQPGQQVRMWGLWHTVHDVRGERSTLGGLAMVLRLDGGAVVRVGAAEPLTVRDGVSSPPRGGRGKGARSDYA